MSLEDSSAKQAWGHTQLFPCPHQQGFGMPALQERACRAVTLGVTLAPQKKCGNALLSKGFSPFKRGPSFL